MIYRNPALKTLTALQGLTTIAGDLSVTQNICLPALEAQALRDAVQTIGGAVTLSANIGPC